MKILDEQYIRENYERLISNQVSYRFEDVNQVILGFYEKLFYKNIYFYDESLFSNQNEIERNISKVDSKIINRLRECGLLDLGKQSNSRFLRKIANRKNK